MNGAIVLSTNQGLGILAKQLYDHKIIHKVLIYPHSSRTNHPDWFPNGKIYSEENIEWFLDKIDSILYIEEPFNWKLIPRARERGIKNVFMPMYECTRNPMPYEPDVILCPSLLDYEYYKNKPNVHTITIPTDVTWKLRKKAKVFIHNAGNGGLGGRNGTLELIEAMRYVKSPLKLIIRTQEKSFKCNDPRVEIRNGTVPYEELWNEGDVFIFPEKFNGLSLPLQEAFASGMLVMAGNRFPMNTWLPINPLIPVKGYKKETIAVEFDCAQYDPRDIALVMDAWYGQKINKYSLMGQEWAKHNSWSKFRKTYDSCIKA